MILSIVSKLEKSSIAGNDTNTLREITTIEKTTKQKQEQDNDFNSINSSTNAKRYDRNPLKDEITDVC